MSLPFIKHHPSNGVKKDQPPQTEVVPKAKRRQFSASYKLRILEEYERATKPGERGALLRREGLYSSNLTAWRRQRDQGQIGALSPKQRGPKLSPDAALVREVTRLQKENQRLERKLKQAELIIDVQKKVSALLGIDLEAP
jgi:transposase-like protein